MVQKVAALLADGSINVWVSVEEDLWEETAEELGSVGSQGPELSASAAPFEVPGRTCLMLSVATKTAKSQIRSSLKRGCRPAR